jgi:hypothetical protein
MLLTKEVRCHQHIHRIGWIQSLFRPTPVSHGCSSSCTNPSIESKQDEKPSIGRNRSSASTQTVKHLTGNHHIKPRDVPT